MSTFGHGRTGGGGVRPRQNDPPRDGAYAAPQRDRSQPDDTVVKYWPAYLEGGYFDAEGNLRIEYVTREKVEPLVSAMANASPRLTTGQLRRFFMHCRAIETRLKTGQSSWGAERRHIEFLDAAAQDAYGKSQRKIPGLFFDFISCNVHAVKSEKDFRDGFLPHFEALVGYGSGKLQERN
jgi:hypothetical protein